MDSGAWWATVHRVTESDMTGAAGMHALNDGTTLGMYKMPLSRSLSDGSNDKNCIFFYNKKPV